MTIQALDPSEFSVLRAWVDADRRRTDDAAAAQLGCTPFDPLAVWQRRFQVGHHFVRREGSRVVAYGSILTSTRARTAHNATLQLAVASERGRTTIDVSPLLTMLLDLADNWLGTWRVSIEILAEDTRWPSLQAHGFEREVIRKGRIFLQGQIRDTWLVTRIRPGFTPHVTQRETPPWPPINTLAPEQTLSIRTSDAKDAPGFAEVFRDPALAWGVLQIPHVASVEAWKVRLAANDRVGRHGLVAEIDGVHVGNAGLTMLEHPSQHVAALGMGVRAEYQGRGIGRALMTTLLEIGEQHLGATRIELEVYTDNHRAAGLYRSFGFEVEGTLRFHALRDGSFVDSWAMARVSPS